MTDAAIGPELVEVRCRGCRRLLGKARSDFRIYCDDLCASDYPTVIEEARDALLWAIYTKRYPAKAVLAREFGMTRQRVDQILLQRDLRIVPSDEEE